MFKTCLDAGIDGFWTDMNEPVAWGQNIPDLVQFDFDGHKTTMSQAHNVYGMNYREPWIYGKEAEKVNRELINQRYRLLPYIYSTASSAR